MVHRNTTTPSSAHSIGYRWLGLLHHSAITAAFPGVIALRISFPNSLWKEYSLGPTAPITPPPTSPTATPTGPPGRPANPPTTRQRPFESFRGNGRFLQFKRCRPAG